MTGPVNHSYLYGEDKVNNWGYAAFFTYYGEFGRPYAWVGRLEAALLAIVFVASIVTNGCLALVIIKYRQLQTVTNYFIINLAVVDVLFASGIPLVAITRVTETWILGGVLCNLLLYFQFVCGAVLLWTLTMISLERYRCIVRNPVKHRISKTHALLLIAIIWLIFFVFFIPVAIWFNVIELPYGTETVKVCTLIFPNVSVRISYAFITLTLILTCLLPIVWLIFNYYSIFRTLLKNDRRWQNWSVNRSSVVTTESNQDLSASDEMRHRKRCRTMKILFFDVCITLIMWLPITVMMGLIHFDSSKDKDYFVESCHLIGTLFAALLNTCVNPTLYGFLNTRFRHCFVDMINKSWICRRCKSSTPTSSSSEPALATLTPPLPSSIQMLSVQAGNDRSKNPVSILQIKDNRGSVESVRETVATNDEKSSKKLDSIKKIWTNVTNTVTKNFSK